MNKTTLSIIRNNLKIAWREYKDIYSVFISYQLIARLIGSLFFVIYNSFILQYIYNYGESFENFNILYAFNYRLLLPLGAIYLVGSVFVLVLEFLGLIYITKQYHEQKEITFLGVIKQIVIKLPIIIKSQILQFLVYFGYVLGFVFVGLLIYSIFSFYISIFLIIAISPVFIFFMWSQWVKFIYVNYKIFENNNTVFSLFDYKLDLKWIKELWLSSIIILLISVIVSILYCLLASLFLLFFVFIGANNFIISFGVSFLLLISTIAFFALSVFTSGFLVVYRSIFYYKTFKSESVDFESISILPSKYIHIAKKYLKPITVVILLISMSVSLIQSFEINESIESYTDDKFLIMAHRGGGGVENTLSNIKNTIDNGIESIEIDIQITKDNIPVLYHDQSLEKVSQNGNLSDFTYQEIKDFSYSNGEKILLLEDLLIEVGNEIRYNFELKIYDQRYQDLVDNTLKIIDRYDIKNSIFTSLEYEIIKILESTNKSIDTGLIITASVGNIDKFETDWFIVNNLFYITSEKKFDNSGKKLAIWSFDADWLGDSAFYEAVDGVVTDNPEELNEIVMEYNDRSRKGKIIPALLWLGEDKILEVITVF